jgi:hypothetical protein
MNSSSFLRTDGSTAAPRHAWWSNWLPSLSQVQQAVQLNFEGTPANVWALSMRQGMGLVVVAAILAGFLPFLVNTVVAIRVGAPLPFLELAQQAQDAEAGSPSQFGEAFQTLAGLEPAVLPPWLAALLSTIGAWINWPLRWLAWWIVYGTATLLVAKVWGAPTTLQRFFALTSYAAAPLVLTTLGPIPCLGALAQIVAWVWAIAVYVTGVRVVTGLDWGRAAVAVLLPAAIASLVGIVLLLAAATTFLRMLF